MKNKSNADHVDKLVKCKKGQSLSSVLIILSCKHAP